MGYGEEFNALGGGGIGTGHLTLTIWLPGHPTDTLRSTIGDERLNSQVRHKLKPSMTGYKKTDPR